MPRSKLNREARRRAASVSQAKWCYDVQAQARARPERERQETAAKRAIEERAVVVGERAVEEGVEEKGGVIVLVQKTILCYGLCVSLYI
jgi:hypothetical protein